MKLKTIHSIEKRIADLKKERERLIEMEKKLSVFSTFEYEKKDEIRPNYDYSSFQDELERVEEAIRNLTAKAIHLLSTEKVKEYHDMTILEMLLLLKDLKEKEQKLYDMSTHLETERYSKYMLVEYEHINYDISKVDEDLQKTKAEIDKITTYIDFFIYELSYDFPE